MLASNAAAPHSGQAGPPGGAGESVLRSSEGEGLERLGRKLEGEERHRGGDLNVAL